MSSPLFGMLTVPYYEWWLHNNPFRPQGYPGYTCPICSSDTGCRQGCPARAIQNKLEDIKALMVAWESGREERLKQ